MDNPQSKDDYRPSPDKAEADAFFPSPYSLGKFTSSKSNLSGADYERPYRGGRWKILLIGADERYLKMDNGTLFSTGNHPIETLLPMYHLEKAGFSFDIATLSGNSVKFEHWAMPQEDSEVKTIFSKYGDKFHSPLKLADVVASSLDDDSDYIGIFIPGGHGALIGLPQSAEIGKLLEWTAAKDKFIISLCHGPAAFLALGDSPAYKGYKIMAFPDAIDAKTPDMGYMPGHLTWKFGERLKEKGFEVLNAGISGEVYRDRNLVTGDSPLAANALGKLAAATLLEAVG